MNIGKFTPRNNLLVLFFCLETKEAKIQATPLLAPPSSAAGLGSATCNSLISKLNKLAYGKNSV
ncbi:hypothetical protein HYN49_10400 [Flavobacterium pallidum]|uniref:Uncharacterized protein n=1 Tax=Flavobacterium pallidum TaxID=2172098 RepID=A0A2S1SIP3_9FLAO|nr:hypothetical protein HYN49_10400 [Flavobacterium pallidum]